MDAERKGAMKPYVQPEPCPGGEHALHPHNHAHVPDEYAPRCSGRFWCTRCKRWFAGEKCRLVPVGKAA